MLSMQKSLVAIALGAILIATSASLGWWFAHAYGDAELRITSANANETNAPSDKKILYWYDPMMPQQHFDQPGKSPFMDMELVPKYASSDDDSSSVTIDPRISQNLGMRVEKVRRQALKTQFDATGILQFNERDIAIEQALAAGFVVKTWPLAPGDVIHAGQPIVTLRIPEWTAAEQEWLAIKATGDSTLLASADERLRQLGLPSHDIRELEKTRVVHQQFSIGASITGVIQTLDGRLGMSVMPGQQLATINGFDPLWLEIAVPEAHTDNIRLQSEITFTLSAFAGETFHGKVMEILPELNLASRSVRLRVSVTNPKARLRAGMTAQVRIESDLDASVLTVPSSAIIRTGKRAALMLAEAEGRYRPVEIIRGRELGDRTVVLSGVSEHESIVVSGQFLLDSEASLSGIFSDSGLSSASQPTDVNTAKVHEADATIVAMDTHGITLKHGPFERLSMPGMTMRFPLANEHLSHGFNIGDRVRVAVSEQEEGLIVERLSLQGEQP